MKKLATLIMLFCFSVVMFADVGHSPPVEKQGIEITITTDFVAFEMPVINPIAFEGVAISTGGIILISYDINYIMIEWLNNDSKLKALKSNYPIQETLKEGTGGDYSLLASNIYFNYSYNKLLKQSWQSKTLRNKTRFINA